MGIYSETVRAFLHLPLLAFPIGILLIPLIATLFVSFAILDVPAPGRVEAWRKYRVWARFVLAATVAFWWIFYDAAVNSKAAPRWWLPPMLALGLYLITCYAMDKILLKLRWTMLQILWRVWWKLVSFVVPLLMVAAGFDAIFDGRIAGAWWLLAAGLLTKIGTAISRLADGLKLNTLKSGETRNRALKLASRMGVKLDRVFVVPAGKAHLTNAYGMSNAIGLTDNLGKYLSKSEVDFVIAHELAHVKFRHGRKHLMIVLAIFAGIALLFFGSSSYAPSLRPLLQVVVILGPLIALNYFSRQREYAADAEAVQFTGDPESALRALIHLNRVDESPIQRSLVTELIMSHPAPAHRLKRIAETGQVHPEQVMEILKKCGVEAAAFRTNASAVSERVSH